MKNEKKQNAIARYFSNFGLKQICDILMVCGAIVILVGLFVSISSYATSKVILAIGFGVYILACVLALVSTVKVLLSKINHRAPEYKRAVTNTVIMAIIFAVAVFALIYLLVA